MLKKHSIIKVSSIQEIVSLFLLSLILVAFCLPLSIFECAEKQIDIWQQDFVSSSFQVMLYTPEEIQAYSERSIGPDGLNIFSSPDRILPEYSLGDGTERTYFTSVDVNAIRQLPEVESVAWLRFYHPTFYIKDQEFSIVLITPDYLEMNGAILANGRFPTDQDTDLVAVLDSKANQIIFGGQNGINERVEATGEGYKDVLVIGVLAENQFGLEPDNPTIYVLDLEPVDVNLMAQPRSNVSPIGWLWIRAKPSYQQQAMESITSYIENAISKNMIVDFQTPRDVIRTLGGIQSRQAYLPQIGWVIFITILIVAVNIGLVVLSLLQQKQYEIGLKRGLGITRFHLLIEYERHLLPRAILSGIWGLGLAYVLIPIFGKELQSTWIYEPLEVSLGPYAALAGIVLWLILWCFVSFIVVNRFLQKTPVELMRNRNRPFRIGNWGQLGGGFGLSMGIIALLIILGLRDGSITQLDKLLGWAGGERAGAIVDWPTIKDDNSNGLADLSSDDYRILQQQFPQATFGWLGRLGGTYRDTLEASASMSVLRPPVMLAGRWFTQEEETRQAWVSVMGYDLAIKVANEKNIEVTQLVGQKWQSYIIIGVLDNWLAQDSMGYRKDVAYIPIGTLNRDKPYYPGGQVAFMAPSEIDLSDFVQQVKDFLINFHPEGDPKFILAADVVNDRLAWRMRLYAIMSTFAGFSLVIGGLGIMNISFLWVLSHWREFGIRRACGANSTNILVHVLNFAIKLAGLATLIGSITGTLMAGIIQLIKGWQLTIYPYWVIASIVTGFGIAFLFSIVPAIWAARQHPKTLLSVDL